VSGVAKAAYYGDRAMKRTLAERYFEYFAPARRILDVGCGTGDFGRHRPSHDIEIHGVDVDAGAVERAKDAEIAVCVDLESSPLPYSDASFDAVLARDILEHLRDPGRLVREIHRVLRPNGRLFASVVVAKPRRVWADYTHVRGFTRQSARLLLEDAGFAVEAIDAMGGIPLSDRLGFMRYVPDLLRLPVLDQLWTSSWEMKAVRPPDAARTLL
jgi:SAM-dependent methyltransferase